MIINGSRALLNQEGCPSITVQIMSLDFTSKAIRQSLNNLEIGPSFIEPGSPCRYGYNKSFNGKLRGELLIGEMFYTLK
jgi:transposase InsO family protein